MPTTLVGLTIFVAFLTPGFLYTSQRRTLAPHSERSALMETTSTVSVSLLSNTLVLAFFGLMRWVAPKHTLDVGALLVDSKAYGVSHLPYVITWGVAGLAASCALAVAGARSGRLRSLLARQLLPVIVESSAWTGVLATDSSRYPIAGLELVDGSHVSGRVAWFSTHLEETGDRELVLRRPVVLRVDDGWHTLDAERVVVSARAIRRLDVTYHVDAEVADGANDQAAH